MFELLWPTVNIRDRNHGPLTEGTQLSARIGAQLIGMGLLVTTLGLSFTGYLLPWDQLAYWAITIGANIAASPNELVAALGLPAAFNIGDLERAPRGGRVRAAYRLDVNEYRGQRELQLRIEHIETLAWG